MADPTPDELQSLKAAGQLIAPFCLLFTATLLTAARYIAAGEAYCTPAMRRVFREESLRDATDLTKAIW